MDISTLCIHGAKNDTHNTGAVSVPIYQSATFAHLGVGKSTGYDYSRIQKPTREYLEQTIAALENGIDAMAFPTGMAAVTALMELFSIGDHIIVSDDLYGGTLRLFETYPMYQTHADVPIEDQLARGINEKLLRLSVGLEKCR